MAVDQSAAGSGAILRMHYVFSILTGVRPMVEVFPLEQAALAFDKMMSGKVHFRAVLKIGGKQSGEILKIIQEKHSSRVPFDRYHLPAKQDLMQILEAARWAPTAYKHAEFEIIVVDDKNQLEKLGNIESRNSEDFLRENYQQFSFSEEELLQKKVGILGSTFPPSCPSLRN